MKQILMLFAVVVCACLSTTGQSVGKEQVRHNPDSIYFKKGKQKFQSKHHFSFYYSSIWRQLGKEYFDEVIRASYKELDPSTDYEAGFNLINNKNEYIFPRFHLETNLTDPPSMEELKKQLGEYSLAKVFEDDKKGSWSKQQAEQVMLLSSNKPILDEKRHIIYFASKLELKGQGDLYGLNVVFFGKHAMVAIKFFLPFQEKDKYLDAVCGIIESFHFDKGSGYQD
jgi:hypothetical protein